MNIAMKYEKVKGGNPKDVSNQNVGYDIVSERPYSDRYIEVKTRSEEGKVSLTNNEWEAAKSRGNNYFLYVVIIGGYSTRLYVIKNPATNCKAVLSNDQYVIDFDTIKSAAEDTYHA